MGAQESRFAAFREPAVQALATEAAASVLSPPLPVSTNYIATKLP